MSVLFFLIQFSVPCFLKCGFNRTAAPFYARCLSLFQDLFVISLLFFLFPLSIFLGFLLHVYLVLDAALYKEMKLRLRWSDVFYLRDMRSLLSSAKEMGLYRFFGVVAVLFLGHGLSFFVCRPVQIDVVWVCWAAVGLLSGLVIPKSFRYAVNHPFFLRRPKVVFKKTPLSQFSLFRLPKTFEIPLGSDEKPHIVFLFLESFAAKYVSPEITPYFHRAIQEGVYFSQFYSNGTLTYRALLSGLFGTPGGNTAVGLSPYVDMPIGGIPEFLKKKGYKTAFHHNGSLSFDAQDRFLKKHFDAITDQHSLHFPLNHIGWGLPDEYLMKYSADWLSEQTAPTFLTLFTISNHHPWVVPPHYKSAQPSRFLQTLEYSDHALGLFLDHLREKELSKKTILFILGDHGQPRGEHQENFYSSRFLYEENVRVPLLILAEGRLQPRVVHEIGSQIDLLPTIVDVWGSHERHLGSSLMRSTPNRSVFFQNPYSEGFLGCRKGDWKWMENCFSGTQELYDLKKDPDEKENLVIRHSAVAEDLKNETRSFFAHTEEFFDVRLGEKFSSYCLDLSNSLVTDAQLKTYGRPEFNRVNLENCLLLTDVGVSSLVSQCPHLEELNLKGVSDLSFEAFSSPHCKLRVLDVSDALHLDGEKLALSCPRIQELSFNGNSPLPFPLRNLVRLKLLDAETISEEQIVFFLNNNPHLTYLMIYGSAQITDQFLLSLKNYSLEVIWLLDAPLITDEGVASVIEMPFRSFVLTGAHLLSEKSRSFLKKWDPIYLKVCEEALSNPSK